MTVDAKTISIKATRITVAANIDSVPVFIFIATPDKIVLPQYLAFGMKIIGKKCKRYQHGRGENIRACERLFNLAGVLAASAGRNIFAYQIPLHPQTPFGDKILF